MPFGDASSGLALNGAVLAQIFYYGAVVEGRSPAELLSADFRPSGESAVDVMGEAALPAAKEPVLSGRVVPVRSAARRRGASGTPKVKP